MHSLYSIGSIAVSAAVVCLACVTAVAQQPQQQQPADLIVTNAKVHTMDERRPQATAFAVKDGKFIAIGDDANVMHLRGAQTRVVDAGGRHIIPGLNDSHIHAVRGGRFYNLELRWDGVESLERGLQMIREQAKRTPKGEWVRVIGGWSPYQFKENRMPTVAELNEAAPDRPVFVLFLYSQGFLNKAGVEAMGLTPQTPAPEGGRYEFVDGGAILHAEPNPTILYKAIAALPAMSDADQINSTKHFYRELNRFGLTSGVDAGGGGHQFPENYEASKTLAQKEGLPLRISFYLFPQKPGKELADFKRWISENQPGTNLDEEHQHGYELEGAGEFLVWSAGDFENFMAPRPELAEGYEKQLRAVTEVLVKNRWPIRIHATYDESITKILDVFEDVFREHNFKGRWIIDHAETISDRNIERIKRLGGGIAIQDRMAYAGEYFLQRYGVQAARSAPPLNRLVASGVPLGAGTDATRVASYNPWVSLSWMVTGKTAGGTELYPPENRLSREEALRLYTVGSAWFSAEEDVKGRIRPGQYADFAVLSGDYFIIPEEQIKNIESVLTMVDGVVVYAAKPFEQLAPPPLPPVSPAWSPVAHFGGYQNGRGRQTRNDRARL